MGNSLKLLLVYVPKHIGIQWNDKRGRGHNETDTAPTESARIETADTFFISKRFPNPNLNPHRDSNPITTTPTPQLWSLCWKAQPFSHWCCWNVDSMWRLLNWKWKWGGGLKSWGGRCNQSLSIRKSSPIWLWSNFGFNGLTICVMWNNGGFILLLWRVCATSIKNKLFPIPLLCNPTLRVIDMMMYGDTKRKEARVRGD